jgi:hypothetical protein
MFAAVAPARCNFILSTLEISRRYFPGIDKSPCARARQALPVAFKAAAQFGAIGLVLRTKILVIAGASLPHLRGVRARRHRE